MDEKERENGSHSSVVPSISLVQSLVSQNSFEILGHVLNHGIMQRPSSVDTPVPVRTPKLSNTGVDPTWMGDCLSCCELRAVVPKLVGSVSV